MAPRRSACSAASAASRSNRRAVDATVSPLTDIARAADVEAWLAASHPYEVPEVVVLPITGGSAKYLAWVDEQTGG